MQSMGDIINRFVPLRYTNAFPSSSRKGTRYPHYIRRLMKRKRIFWKRWKLCNLSADKSLYKTAAADCKRAIQKFHAAKELALIRKNNRGSFYNFVNSKIKYGVNTAGLKTSDGSVITNPYEKVETFNQFFSSVFRCDNGNSAHVADRACSNNLKNILFTPGTVRDVLRKLKPSVSAGADGIPNILLRNCASYLALPLCHIFSISFFYGCLPSSWKYAVVTPVHKKRTYIGSK